VHHHGRYDFREERMTGSIAAAVTELSEEDRVRQTRAKLRYLAEGDFVTRRFVSAGAEHSTGRYEDHEMVIRDGRAIRDGLRLDTHGFQLAGHVSSIADFHNKDEIEARYAEEACGVIRRLTGASQVVARGGWCAPRANCPRPKR
jgi:hypothetical protein